jgi:hypothetical protein
MKRHVPYRKLLVPAIKWWNPENKTNKPTSTLFIINWIQRFGNCGAGPYSKYGKKSIRKALAMAVKSDLLKQIRKSFLLKRCSPMQQKKRAKTTKRTVRK